MRVLKLFKDIYTLKLRNKFSVNASFNVKRYSHKFSLDVSSCDHKENKISSLYVPGRHGGTIYTYIKPIIDLEYIEKHLTAIDQSCRLRSIKLDLVKVVSLLKDWTCKLEKHQKTSEKLEELQDEVKRLKSLDLIKESDLIQEQFDDCLEKLKLARDNLYDIEDIIMPLVQQIPNILDPSSPIDVEIVKLHLEPPRKDFITHSHTEIGGDSFLEFSNISPTAYYLKGPLAELEVSVQVYFSDKLRNAQFAPMSCVDFVRTFLVEATGKDPFSYNHCIPIKNNKSSTKIVQNLNLIGGASLESFCAYLTNMNTDFETFPAKYFSLGRHYDANNRHSLQPSLFSVVQSSRIHCLILSEPANESVEFNSLFEVLLSCYSPLKIPFRTVDVTAAQLNCTESRRKQLELWSPANQQYVPVACISQHNDFISKRLHITYGVKHTVNGYCSIVEGVVVNIPVLLGCIMENYSKGNHSVDFEKISNILSASE